MWKHCIDKYEVSQDGQLRNSKTGRILKPKKNARGYIFYGISIDGKYKDVSIHRAVAMAFIPNPENKEEVNHKDGDKENNHVSNLEWNTPSENVKHAFKTGLNNQEHTKRKVAQIESGIIIQIFDSIIEASIAVNGHRGHITNCCKGKRLTHKGFEWRYM